MEIIYTLPVPDDNSELFIAAFAAQHGWTPDSTVTALEHSRVTLNNYVRESVADQLARQAAAQAQAATINAITTQFDGIASTLTIKE